MPLVATLGSDPGGNYWEPGSSESYFQDSLFRVVLEDLLRCHYFEVSEFFLCRDL